MKQCSFVFEPPITRAITRLQYHDSSTRYERCAFCRHISDSVIYEMDRRIKLHLTITLEVLRGDLSPNQQHFAKRHPLSDVYIHRIKDVS